MYQKYCPTLAGGYAIVTAANLALDPHKEGSVLSVPPYAHAVVC